MSSKTTKRAEGIFQDLQRRILAGELAAGERLPPERDLAAEYDANRHTLREAIRKLEQARLVTVRQGQGATVADFRAAGTLELIGPYLVHGQDARERITALLDLMEARIRVMESALVMVATRARPEDVARIAQVAQRQLEHFQANDRRALGLGDAELIDALLDGAHSLTIRWIANTFIELYRGFIERFPAMWVIDPGYPDYLRELVDAIAAGDGARASTTVGRYLERTDKTLRAMLGRLFDQAEPATEPVDGGPERDAAS